MATPDSRPAPVADDAVLASAATERTECFLGVVVAAEAVRIIAPVSGRVRAVHVRVGDAVVAEDLLLEIESESWNRRQQEAQAALDAARASERRAELELGQRRADERRQRSLRDLVSEAEIESARSAREVAAAVAVEAAAQVRQAEAALASVRSVLSEARVRAPFAGKVATVSIVVGTRLVEGAPLLRIIDPRAVSVRFAIPVRRALSLHTGDSVRVEVESTRFREILTVDAISPGVDPATQMVFAETKLLPFSGEPVLLDGTIARVSLDLAADACPSSTPASGIGDPLAVKTTPQGSRQGARPLAGQLSRAPAELRRTIDSATVVAPPEDR